MPARKLSVKKSVRLSPFVKPISYKIHFEPDLDNFIFSGNEEVLISFKKATKLIKLHSAEIQILEAVVIQGKKSQTGKISYKVKEEEVDFEFKETIKPGKAILKLVFTGILNDKMRGFYRSRYTLDGKEYHMGTTQFESTDARRAFPSFDEPTHKATFEVSFKVPSDRTVISNTIESEILEHEGGFKTVKFSPSPKMSSYLLAFIIGHFEHISKKTKDGIDVRVFVTPGKKRQAEFALEVAVKTLEFYTDYFGIKFPLPSSDLIAIPDFAAGAMENWGAVTYRETALLVDPEQSSTHNKQWVALVIAHELAHQWFGNLVTMEWWTHLWLNEGFASYIEYLAVNKLFPEWHVWTQFVYMDHARALELDGLKNTHPIEVDVSHPAEISEIFDEVSYSKGASVIRMIAEYLGEKNFRDGLRLYLKKHSYDNAKTEDLWSALEAVSHKKIGSIMKNWTGKAGYPLVSVEKKNNKLQLSQKRFFSSIASQKTKDDTIWKLPLDSYLLTKKTGSIPMPQKNGHNVLFSQAQKWVKLNKNETSFARIRYSDELLRLLKDPIFSLDKKLSEEDRFGIIRDAFILSEAGLLTTDIALDLVTAYKNDESYIVWADIAGEVYKLNSLLFGTTSHEAFKKFVVKLFSTIYKKVGWEKIKGESHGTTLLRGIVIGVMGRFGDKDTIKKAQNLYEKDRTGKKKLPADLRGIVYVLVAENGNTTTYNTFLSYYEKETLEEERDRILRALCVFKDKNLLRKTLTLSFSEKARSQDAAKTIMISAGNLYGRDVAWDFVKQQWEKIVEKYGGGHLYNRFVKPFGSFVTEAEAKDIETFFKAHESKGLERTISQVTEQILSSAAWLKRDREKIKTFLHS